MSEPRGYAWSLHSHRLSFCADGSTSQVAHDVIHLHLFFILPSLCGLSLSSVSASAALAVPRISCWRRTDATTSWLFCFCCVSYRVVCVKSGTSAALLCFLLCGCCSSPLIRLFQGLFSLLPIFGLFLASSFSLLYPLLELKQPWSVDLTVSVCLPTLTPVLYVV